jgi:hypothetical protein
VVEGRTVPVTVAGSLAALRTTTVFYPIFLVYTLFKNWARVENHGVTFAYGCLSFYRVVRKQTVNCVVSSRLCLI